MSVEGIRDRVETGSKSRHVGCASESGNKISVASVMTDPGGLMMPPGAWANIPPKRNRMEALCFSPYFYRAQNLVERFFNKIKQCRRVATRYDKLAANYHAFIQLASIRLWLHVNEFTP